MALEAREIDQEVRRGLYREMAQILNQGKSHYVVLYWQGRAGAVTEEDIANLRHELGLDRPIHVQHGSWVWGILRGDLGESIRYKTPVIDDLKGKFAVTLQLVVMGILMAFVVAVPLGDALRHQTGQVARLREPDHSPRGIALPTFWLAILIVYFLAYFFDWLPPWVTPPSGKTPS